MLDSQQLQFVDLTESISSPQKTEKEARAVSRIWRIQYPNWVITIEKLDDGTFVVIRQPPK